MTPNPSKKTNGAPDRRANTFGGIVRRISKYCALFGGSLLLIIMIFVSCSVISATLFARPILGDFEVVEFTGGIAVFAFLPFCHLEGANVVIEFIEKFISPRLTAVLDVIGALLFLLVAVVIVWRLGEGGIQAFEAGDETMFLQIPIWAGHLIGFGFGLVWIAAAIVVLVEKWRIATVPTHPDAERT